MNRHEIMKSAMAAGSPEELLKIARENGMNGFTEESANAYYELLHKSGELSDEELESAAGGCSTGGKTVVSCNHECHNGKYQAFYRSDHKSLRHTWETFTHIENPGYVNKCGYCGHLGFTAAGTGYCEVD